MRFSKLLFGASFLAVLLCFCSQSFGFVGDPPEITGSAEREGIMVEISGTIDDESPDTVQLKVIGLGGPGANIPIEIVDGAFSFEIRVPLGTHTITLEAKDSEGQYDTEAIDIPF